MALTWNSAQAQQVHQLSNYVLNPFAFNPAVVGHDAEHVVMKGIYRRQWAGGFDGAEPTTFTLSAHSNFTFKRTIGLGLMLFNDKTGPTSQTGAQVAYAYHIPLERTAEHFLALGVSANVIQYSLDFSKIDVLDTNDPTILMNTESQTSFDANFGVFLHGPKYWVGISALQLAQTKYQLGGNPLGSTDPLELGLARHFYGMAGYEFKANNNIDVTPSVLVKYVENVPLHFEANVRAMYKDQYWAGVGYRANDAINLMLGVQFDNGLNIAYAYDIITSGVSSVSNGSHEVVIGYNYYWLKGPSKARVFED